MDVAVSIDALAAATQRDRLRLLADVERARRVRIDPPTHRDDVGAGAAPETEPIGAIGDVEHEPCDGERLRPRPDAGDGR